MIDSHAHLTDPTFTTDLSNVINRAKSAGVERIFVVSENPNDFDKAQSLCTAYGPQTVCALGLHPCYVSTLCEQTLSPTINAFKETASFNSTTIHAIAEVGLDFTPYIKSLSPLAEKMQVEAFNIALSVAATHHLPLSVHSRGAGRRALEQIMCARREASLSTVIMHAFDGRPIHAERALENMCEGLYFSVPPSIARSEGMKKLVRRLPLERILLESDSPALPAVQGERNEPCEIVNTVPVIAEVKGMDVDRVRAIIEDNERTALPRVAMTDR